MTAKEMIERLETYPPEASVRVITSLVDVEGESFFGMTDVTQVQTVPDSTFPEPVLMMGTLPEPAGFWMHYRGAMLYLWKWEVGEPMTEVSVPAPVPVPDSVIMDGILPPSPPRTALRLWTPGKKLAADEDD